MRPVDEFRLMSRGDLKVWLKGKPHFKLNEQVKYLVKQAEYLLTVTIRDEHVFRNLVPLTWLLSKKASARTLDALSC